MAPRHQPHGRRLKDRAVGHVVDQLGEPEVLKSVSFYGTLATHFKSIGTLIAIVIGAIAAAGGWLGAQRGVPARLEAVEIRQGRLEHDQLVLKATLDSARKDGRLSVRLLCNRAEFVVQPDLIEECRPFLPHRVP